MNTQPQEQQAVNEFFRANPKYAKEFYINRAKIKKSGCFLPPEQITTLNDVVHSYDSFKMHLFNLGLDSSASNDLSKPQILKEHIREALNHNRSRALISTKLEGQLMAFSDAKMIDAAVGEKLTEYDNKFNYPYPNYWDIAGRKGNCYNSGKVAVSDQKALFIPDEKCSDKLCPHCSNKETRRIILIKGNNFSTSEEFTQDMLDKRAVNYIDLPQLDNSS